MNDGIYFFDEVDTCTPGDYAQRLKATNDYLQGNTMHWNHRIMKRTDIYGCPYYTIHEVYYTDGQPDSWTEQPVYPVGNTIEELREELEQMLECFTKPIIDYPE